MARVHLIVLLAAVILSCKIQKSHGCRHDVITAAFFHNTEIVEDAEVTYTWMFKVSNTMPSQAEAKIGKSDSDGRMLFNPKFPPEYETKDSVENPRRYFF